MKKIIIVLVCCVALSGCITPSVTQYTGEIYPSNATFNNPNFKYIKTIKGVSEATYNNGWDEKKTEGLVNEAKQNMYSQHPLIQNQVPTNITLDIMKTSEPTFNGKNTFLQLNEIKVIVTADVFEFSNNGIYSSSNNSIDEPKTIENNSKKLITIDYTEFVKVNHNSLPRKYNKGEEVIFNSGNIYKGTIYARSNFEKAKVSNIYEARNGKWVPINSSNELIVKTIQISNFTHYRP
jgi:hypothetical protein